MMKQIGLSGFINEMNADQYSNYSNEALELIFNHMEEIENESGRQYIIDRVAIRSTYTEYKSEEEIKEEYIIESITELTKEILRGKKAIVVVKY